MSSEFPPSRRITFREQVMAGKVPIGYQELVDVPEPGVVVLKESGRVLAKARDVDEKRIEFLMRDG